MNTHTPIPTLDFLPVGKNWTKAMSGDIQIGGFGETNRTNPSMRWYWQTEEGSYGYEPTAAGCISAMYLMAPTVFANEAERAVQAAEYDALSPTLKALVDNANRLEAECLKVFHRDPFEREAYIAASEKAQAARMNFIAAVGTEAMGAEEPS